MAEGLKVFRRIQKMKNYRITVNGNVYDVTVEETPAGAYLAPAQNVGYQQTAQFQPTQTQQVQYQQNASVAQAPVLESQPVQQVTGQTESAAEGKIRVLAPMPGKILKVSASVGQNVKKGETLLILEAMKMENEIVAPQDGVIASINVSVGSAAESGELLATLN